MSTRTLALIISATALILIAVLCGLGVSSILNQSAPKGAATTPSGQFTQWSNE